jgi:hypothetical protein
LFDGEVSGIVWLDSDGNGSPAGEPGVSGATVFIDLDFDGQLDFFHEPIARTNFDGEYTFNNLPAGTYHVRYTAPQGFAITSPESGYWEVTLQRDESRTAVNFGQQPPAEIRGIVWHDLDGDDLRDVTEQGLPNWIVYADLNHDGARNLATATSPGEPFVMTDASGQYALPVTAGTYVVRAEVQAAWSQSFPGAGGHPPISVAQGQVFSNVNFGSQFSPGEIRGVVWHDENGNGIRDDVGNDGVFDEPGQFGVTVYLDMNENGRRDAEEEFRTTAGGGNYVFAELSAQHIYVVAEEVPANDAQTFPGFPALQVHRVSLVAGQAAMAHFGNTEESMIHGTVFQDLDDDELPGGFEPRLAGRTIFVDANRNSRLDPREPFGVTDIRGEYLIRGLPPGVHAVIDSSDVATLRDPHTAFGQDFGFSLAVAGDSIIVGDPRALRQEHYQGTFVQRGRVYAFSRNSFQFVNEFDDIGLADFTDQDGFGFSVAAMEDRALVGSPFRRVFGNSNGLLETSYRVGTVTEFDLQGRSRFQYTPSSDQYNFDGASLAWLGGYHVVGAPGEPHHLYPNAPLGQVIIGGGTALPSEVDENGNPTSPVDFGESLAVLGAAHLLVGDPAESTRAAGSGAVSFFEDLPDLLPDLEDGEPFFPTRTFRHPAGQGDANFGVSLAGLGANALIGAPGDDAGGDASGAVYLFDTNTGNLLQTFLNPSPAAVDHFGYSITVVGDQVLVGAPGDDTLGANAGAAYLFDAATGELQHTFYSPSPLAGAEFGFCLAAVDEHRFIVGAPSRNDITEPGAAYVFSIPSRVTIAAPDQTATLHFPRIDDDDADGVPNNVEDRPDGTVDSNRDSVPDRQQSNVATLKVGDGNYVTLVAPGRTSFVDVGVSPILPPGAPQDATFPFGLFDFTLEGVPAGSSVDIEFIFGDGASFDAYYKYGPTSSDPTPHWYSFEFDATQTGAHVPTSNEPLVVTFIDGGRGDDDPAPGRIRDPGGPAIVMRNPNPLAGDYNRNGAVDAADYVVWRKMENRTVTPYQGADGSGDGVVDQDDYSVWRADFGRQLPPPGKAANVPTIEVEGDPAYAAAQDSRAPRDGASALPPETIVLPRLDSHFSANRQRTNFSAVVTPIEHDGGLMAWLASQPTVSKKEQFQYLDFDKVQANKNVSSEPDIDINSLDQLFGQLDEDWSRVYKNNRRFVEV